VAVALLMFLLFRDEENRLAYSLVLGGAAGNLTDRIMYGYVIDFVDVFAASFHWPAFNVADSALTVGISLMFVAVFLSGRRDRAGADSRRPPTP
jgi:signal peptidase II